MRFRRHLKQTHGEKYWTDERLVYALNEFESFKKTFSPKGEPLTLKVDASLGLKRNRYTMTQDDMKAKIFEPIMKDVVCLIKEQIKMAGDGVAAVIMVGGFGQSRYLKSRIRDAISSRTEVLQPESGWVAVGESYPEGKPSTIEYQCDLPVTLGHEPQTEIDIYSNNDDGKPPIHRDGRTQHIGTLSLDLRKIPDSTKRTAKIRRMGLHRYYCLQGAIEAVYGSAEITYSVKLGGVTHDMISVRYER
ncbi:hypothetical protein F66182_11546 [Fusarium sp. NRRL 66182]|nr:hypothetical protein F66182_11546 [Fusarium sp. NRRL 66182]